jgi:hypothetical protein
MVVAQSQPVSGRYQMGRKAVRPLISATLIGLAVVSIGSVAAQEQSTIERTTPDRRAAPPPRTDPFAYCRSVKNSEPDFNETNTPRVICERIGFQYGGEFKNVCMGIVWRCQDGNVYGCITGASGRACQHWDTSKKPTQNIRQYCARNPNSGIPNSNNDTPYNWHCNGTLPTMDSRYQAGPFDKQGYFADAWKRISPSR